MDEGHSGIEELGHTGVYAFDLELLRGFYRDVVGLEVTDEDPDIGIVFLSSRPASEHHELVLQRGRTAPADTCMTNQISWRMRDYDALWAGYRRLLAADAPVQQVVTHGNAIGVYFLDPEGTRNEFYWPTGASVAQPFRRSIELDPDVERVLRASAELVASDDHPYQPTA